MNEWISNNFLMFMVFFYLAAFGFLVLLFKIITFFSKVKEEAKEKNKMVEFSGVMVGIISITIALISLFISYGQNKDINLLRDRLQNVENVIKK